MFWVTGTAFTHVKNLYKILGNPVKTCFDMYGDSRENLLENLADVILSLISSVCGIFKRSDVTCHGWVMSHIRWMSHVAYPMSRVNKSYEWVMLHLSSSNGKWYSCQIDKKNVNKENIHIHNHNSWIKYLKYISVGYIFVSDDHDYSWILTLLYFRFLIHDSWRIAFSSFSFFINLP